jgi:hypothetical protein
MKKYSFGVWESADAINRDAEEGLRIDSNGRATQKVYNLDGNDRAGYLDSNAYWLELDTSRPLREQVEYKSLTRYVNQNILNDYRDLFTDLQTKMDMGGITEKDRLRPTSNPLGIFSFGLASPTLYRRVEWYVPDLNILVDGEDVTSVEMAGETKYYAMVNGVQYNCWRQQDGTKDILDYVPDSKRTLTDDGMFITIPESGEGTDGNFYRLKYATKNKKIYLEKPKETGEAQFIDLFINIGGRGGMNSSGMFSKIAPIMMLAEKLENAGVRTRIYGLFAQSVDSQGIDELYYSFVAKEYGEKVDIDRVASLTGDPRFFRVLGFNYCSGLVRKLDKVYMGCGSMSTMYGGASFDAGFEVYKNFLWKQKGEGLLKSKVKEKSLLITSQITEPDNNFKRNEERIVEEFYRISDVAEMVLAKDPEKAIRRMVERDRKRGKSDADIKKKLRTSVNRAFYIVTPNVNDKYFDEKEDVEKLTQREKRITKSINSILG